jgi:hypothetical protein
VAIATQPLLIAFVVNPALSQWGNVVALRGKTDAALPLALSAKRSAREQSRAHLLQSPASDPLDGNNLYPGLPRVRGAATTTVAYQHVAADDAAGAWC